MCKRIIESLKTRVGRERSIGRGGSDGQGEGKLAERVQRGRHNVGRCGTFRRRKKSSRKESCLEL